MNIQILYEDKHIIAVNKPAGLMVHEDGRNDVRTLTHWILENYPDTHGVGEPVITSDGKVLERPGIIHRLDRETSGVILVAKTPEGFGHLKLQFQNRTIEKTYHAFVYGKVKESEGEIDRAIGRSSSDFRKFSAQRGARGTLKDAVTEYKVLEQGNDWTLLEVYPKTGRTHQIRVHLKAIHHPVISDGLYAPKGEKMFGFSRVALHAREITFVDVDGKKQKVSAPYPQDFENAFDQLGLDIK